MDDPIERRKREERTVRIYKWQQRMSIPIVICGAALLGIIRGAGDRGRIDTVWEMALLLALAIFLLACLYYRDRCPNCRRFINDPHSPDFCPNCRMPLNERNIGQKPPAREPKKKQDWRDTRDVVLVFLSAFLCFIIAGFLAKMLIFQIGIGDPLPSNIGLVGSVSYIGSAIVGFTIGLLLARKVYHIARSNRG